MENCNAIKLRVVDIIEGTSVDGPGLRTSIYLAGCRHQCPGCQNPETWSFESGRDMTIKEIMEVVRVNDFNVTLTGGDPLYQLPALTYLVKEIKNLGKTVWCYTGFTYDELVRNPQYDDFLFLIDILVDGPYIEDQRDISLRFRGSTNQRIIDCTKSEKDNIVLWHD